MAIGIPAKYIESRRFDCSENELKSAIEAVLESLEWRYSTVSFYTYRADVSTNLFSWGENIVLEILPNSEIQVKSQCAFQPQIIDWGKNRRNVEQFFARLQQTISSYLEATSAEKERWAFNDKGLSPIERVFNDSETA